MRGGTHGHTRTHGHAWARMGTHGHAWARMGTHAHARAHGGPVANGSHVVFQDSIPSHTVTSLVLNLFPLAYGLTLNYFSRTVRLSQEHNGNHASEPF
jgi:hypothetical protein